MGSFSDVDIGWFVACDFAWNDWVSFVCEGQLMFPCIGKRKVQAHKDGGHETVQCTNQSELPSNPARPEWGYLCPECSAASIVGGRAHMAMEELESIPQNEKTQF